MNNPHKKEVFPIHYWQGTLPDNDKLKDLMIPIIEKTKHENLGEDVMPSWDTEKINTSIFNHSANSQLFGRGDVGEEVREQYKQVWAEMFQGHFEVGMQATWFNWYGDGEYQEPQAHPGNWETPNHFACVHFLQYDPEIHSPLIFNDPLKNLKTIAFSPEYCDDGGYNWKFEVPVKEGDMVVFPYYLEHGVRRSPSTPEYPRISIATNIRVMSYEPFNN